MKVISAYNVIYICANIFSTYVLFKFMRIFYDTRNKNKRIELLSYSIYFLLITFIHLKINVPIIMMVCNLIFLFILSWNYKASISKRIVSTLFIYFMLMSIEAIVGLLTGYFQFSIYYKNDYLSIWGLIGVKVISYMVVIILDNQKNIKKGTQIPIIYWISIIMIPFSSLYISQLLFRALNLSLVQVMVGVILLLLSNVATFSLYDRVIVMFEDKIQVALLKKQNSYYDKQFELMQISQNAIKSVKHDLKNHLLIIGSYIEEDKKEKALTYIQDILELTVVKKGKIFSGNFAIDSILNFKLQEAEQNNISVILEQEIPEGLNVTSCDMTIILGNLLDNAIQAAKKLNEEKKREIQIHITYSKGRLFIQINNYYNGKLFIENNKIVTSKADKENHGIGLQNVENALEKCNGIMKIKASEEVLSVTVLMYIEKEE